MNKKCKQLRGEFVEQIQKLATQHKQLFPLLRSSSGVQLKGGGHTPLLLEPSPGTLSTGATAVGKEEACSRHFSDIAAFIFKKPELFRICFLFCTSL
jgi:hypothetical protein